MLWKAPSPLLAGPPPPGPPLSPPPTSPPPPSAPQPLPTWQAWQSDDPRCELANFPTLFDKASLDALKAAQNGTVSPNVRACSVRHAQSCSRLTSIARAQQWLAYMQTFLEGLEQLRATAVPLECVPPPFRSDAVEEAAEFAAAAPSGAPVPSSATPTPSAPAGRKLHEYVDPLASSVDDAAVAAAAAAAAKAQAALRLENLKSLFLNLRVTEFGTAIFELVVFEQVQEDINIQARSTRMAAPLLLRAVL